MSDYILMVRQLDSRSKKKLPQPDNRNHDQDGAEDEICLAVLNNFYNDNIKWHDVACHHKKPTICELP